MRLCAALPCDKLWNLSAPHPDPLLVRRGEGELFVGRLPGVVAALQHRANVRSAFSAFEFVPIREIRGRTFVFSAFLRG